MNAVLTAIDRVDIAEYVDTLIWIYVILIFIRILLSWVPRVPDQPFLRAAIRFIEDVTEPYLAIWRRVIPPIGGGLDISPILAVFALTFAGRILVNLIAG
jgi:uncharacterized protein YggT (Ycf19 family)